MWSRAVFELAAFALASKFLHHTTSSQAASFPPPLGPSTPTPRQDHTVILQNLARLMYVSPINHLPLVLMSLAQKGTTVSPIEVWPLNNGPWGWWWWHAVPMTRCVMVTAMTNNVN